MVDSDMSQEEIRWFVRVFWISSARYSKRIVGYGKQIIG